MDFAKIQNLIHTNELDKAAALMDFEQPAADPREAITKAKFFMKSNAPEKALDVLKQNIEIFPSHSPTFLELGILYFDLKSYVEAVPYLKSVLTAQPNNLIAKNYLALIDLINGNTRAVQNRLTPENITDNIGFRVRLVEYIETQWLAKQSFYTEKSPAENAANHPKTLNPKKAVNEFYRRRFDRMAAYMPEPPVDSDETAFLGAIAGEMCNRFDLALQYLENHNPGGENSPDLIKAVYGRCLIRTGNFTLGAEILNQIEITGPEDYGVNYYMGIVNLAWGRHEAARSCFTTALTTYMVDTLDFQWQQLTQALNQYINDSTNH